LNQERQAIWIDLDNSPHVPLFAPVIKHYRDAGVEVIVTARDHAQTLELLKLHGIDKFAVIGRHYGKGKPNKIRGLVIRARQLASHIKSQPAKPSVALSHGSRSMVLAAKWLGIPVITMYDYEWTETGIFNRFSDRVLVPDMIPDDVLDQIKLKKNKRAQYVGIKEELYVRDFAANADFRARFLTDHRIPNANDRILVLLRPPATSANYHSPQSDRLFAGILKHLTDSPDTLTVVMPRTRAQADEIRASTHSPNFLILDNAINGLDLINAADVVISGGGTMNREAVLLGVPVYSIFAGRQGALDAQMETDGLITFIRGEDDVAKIALEKRASSTEHKTALTDRVERFVIDQIDAFLTKN
jgi:hypothetical protein